MTREARDRGMNDLLKAERDLRKVAEEQYRGLRSALEELGYRIAGDALEEIRRQDPVATEGWGAEEWREFFAQHLKEQEGWVKPEVMRKRMEAVKGERDDALRELAEFRKRLAEIESLQLGMPAEIIGTPAEAGEMNSTEPLDAGIGIEWPEIPRKPPARFATRVSTGERWRREALTMYLIASHGLSLRLEILEGVGKLVNVGARSGSLRRMVANGLVPKGLVAGDVLGMYLSKPSKLAVLRLTEDGRDLCRTLGWEPIESEWERLVRLHDGESQEAHTAAVLAFAYHSRRRGWRAEVLPPMNNGTKAQPDALVSRNGDKVFVEVEMGDDKPKKWRNMVDLQGFVALCAATAEKRERLSNECKLDGLKGQATDIETLIQESGGVTGKLWVEEW